MIQCIHTNKYISKYTVLNHDFKNEMASWIKNSYFWHVIMVETWQYTREMCICAFIRLLGLKTPIFDMWLWLKHDSIQGKCVYVFESFIICRIKLFDIIQCINMNKFISKYTLLNHYLKNEKVFWIQTSIFDLVKT